LHWNKTVKIKSFCFRNDIEKLVENLNADIKNKITFKKTNEGFISEYTMKRLSIKKIVFLYGGWIIIKTFVIFLGPVTKIENIKTDATKILRPTHFGE
jgi:retron-type reverse transcriptase